MNAATACAGSGPGADDPLFVDDGRDWLPPGWTARPDGRGAGAHPALERLYSTIVDLDGGGSRPSLAFCALVAESPEEVLRRLAARYGGWLVSDAVVVEGVDRTDPRVDEMVTDSLMALIDEAAGGSAREGFDVSVERRFA